MNLPSWWGGKSQKRAQNARTRRQERDRAKEVGGKAQPGSGSHWSSPGDVRANEYLEELKDTAGQSYRINAHDWELLRRRAALEGRSPRMIVEIRGGPRKIRLCIEEV